eukprot:1115594-Rhodomonas_salina.1
MAGATSALFTTPILGLSPRTMQEGMRAKEEEGGRKEWEDDEKMGMIMMMTMMVQAVVAKRRHRKIQRQAEAQIAEGSVHWEERRGGGA